MYPQSEFVNEGIHVMQEVAQRVAEWGTERVVYKETSQITRCNHTIEMSGKV